ncbi:phosphoenolpyruvate carboxykinase (GTP) [Dermatophilus congolensis]|uniref:phosphoenolpyruvate carboxykinase (GTP) n=1 Tax=Dermatophilus congolensis TaxID=1863 RepID=UPI001AAE90A1|nr:phosphoenolpyruvate carboxykinase (GTP) [Dermatophilus congolensis]MBO3130854.1 phosphoenolpyruvate carboxykinase (GTP) [Dermatophilus congolensis]MBO3134988.1 phosphoenolpyruvate carboxykinase (GTP) [Dermatophilus congolensis]MBO3137227.1 phosphoenolpyruvate carboxykinase (GTP) [Dermatophilus congolensis]MBO3139472.1 phosphoenolpyruvate carboxykinase (GTP) [Dermatophilus congolensis]
MVDVVAAMDKAGLTNASVREFVSHWAEVTGAKNVEVVSASDDARLIQEALDAGELQPAGEGRYYSRSYSKDTARSESRTIVATADEKDKGVYNNWRHSNEMKPLLENLMRGASEGKTMYVIPYLMAQPGSPLEKYAAGVELTDNRAVVLHMIRMARVGIDLINNLEDPDTFVRAVHVTGDLENLGQGTPEDKRYFVTVADERLILHFGSSYGGNALLGKIAHGLRQAAYDGWASKKFLGEQYLLLGIEDKETGKKYHITGGFPSASGKTNLAMTLPPDALGDRYSVKFYGDDIAWLWVDEKSGKLMGLNPENGVFGVAKDTNEKTNPTAIAAVQEGSGAIFTNIAYNTKTHEVWWEGRTPTPPADLDGWYDWKGQAIAERSEAEKDEPWAHPNSRFTSTLANVPNVAPDYNDPVGVEIDAIIFGGRTRDREPLIRAITDLAEGVYDGLTLGAEATFAAEGVDGQLRYDPMSNRPFMSYSEGDYARHYLDVIGRATDKPLFAHVNWFARDPEDGHYLWPGFRENLRALLWLMDLKAGKAKGRKTAVGILPTQDELNLEGLDIPQEDLDRILSIDVPRWKQEMGFRAEHLEQFPNLPEEIWEAHRRVEADLNKED